MAEKKNHRIFQEISMNTSPKKDKVRQEVNIVANGGMRF